MHVVLSKCVAVGLNLDHRVLADAVELRFAATRDAAKDRAHFPGESFHFVVRVTKNLANEVGPRTRHDLIEPHLDRLRHENVLPRHAVEQGLADQRA